MWSIAPPLFLIASWVSLILRFMKMLIASCPYIWGPWLHHVIHSHQVTLIASCDLYLHGNLDRIMVPWPIWWSLKAWCNPYLYDDVYSIFKFIWQVHDELCGVLPFSMMYVVISWVGLNCGPFAWLVVPLLVGSDYAKIIPYVMIES